MNAIAQEAGVGIATLYRHFATPADLVLGVVDHLRDRLADTCRRGVERMREELKGSFLTEVNRTVGDLLEHAKAAGLVRQKVEPIRFHVGLGMITRPLPRAADAHLPGQTAWVVETYLRGLRPDRE